MTSPILSNRFANPEALQEKYEELYMKQNSLRAVLFDLDGTLLPMDLEQFVRTYFERLSAYMIPHGYKPRELIRIINAGTLAMVSNDGTASNEAVFWEICSRLSDGKIPRDKQLFEEFYKTVFDSIREVCGKKPLVPQLIASLKARGLRLILATNPIFPPAAIQCRIHWAGLEYGDFEYCTTYDNSHFCKPNLRYYEEILHKCGLSPDECLMVGNDADDDMPAEALGMKVFLLTDCLINKSGKDISVYPKGNISDLLAYIEKVAE